MGYAKELLIILPLFNVYKHHFCIEKISKVSTQHYFLYEYDLVVYGMVEYYISMNPGVDI